MTNLAWVASWEIPIVDHTPDALAAEPTGHLGCTCEMTKVKEACLVAQLQQQVPVNNTSRRLSIKFIHICIKLSQLRIKHWQSALHLPLHIRLNVQQYDAQRITLLTNNTFPVIQHDLNYAVSKKTKMICEIASMKLGRFWWNPKHDFLNKFPAKSYKSFFSSHE